MTEALAELLGPATVAVVGTELLGLAGQALAAVDGASPEVLRKLADKEGE
jgi:hypothetical protein